MEHSLPTWTECTQDRSQYNTHLQLLEIGLDEITILIPVFFPPIFSCRHQQTPCQFEEPSGMLLGKSQADWHSFLLRGTSRTAASAKHPHLKSTHCSSEKQTKTCRNINHFIWAKLYPKVLAQTEPKLAFEHLPSSFMQAPACLHSAWMSSSSACP